MQTFGERLRFSIKKSGKSQKELSAIWRISEDSVGRYIKGDRQPKIDLLEEICNTLNVSVEWLVTGKDNAADLTPDEQKLLNDFRNCSEEIKQVVRAAAASGAAVPNAAALETKNPPQVKDGNLSSSKVG